VHPGFEFFKLKVLSREQTISSSERLFEPFEKLFFVIALRGISGGKAICPKN